MTNLREALYEYINSTTTTAVYTNVPLNATLPYYRLSRISRVKYHEYTGDSGFYRDLWQVDCVAENSAGADTLARALLEDLDEYEGDMIDVDVRSCLSTGMFDSVEQFKDSEKLYYRVVLEFEIMANET